MTEPAKAATILGIDAAWTPGQPSGVALMRAAGTAWEWMVVAPSYGAFLAAADGAAVDWSKRADGGEPDIAALLDAAKRLAGRRPDLLCVDMPLSRAAICGRRAADDAVSQAYGRYWCAAHSPSATRPGGISERLTADCSRLGYPLRSATEPVGRRPGLLEVYPHPAIVEMLGLAQRLPYKVSRAAKYWPDRSPAGRRRLLIENFTSLHDALSNRLGAVPFALPPAESPGPLSALKPYEDALDAAVCCWVGSEYLAGRAIAYGDESAAIWCPSPESGQESGKETALDPMPSRAAP